MNKERLKELRATVTQMDNERIEELKNAVEELNKEYYSFNPLELERTPAKYNALDVAIRELEKVIVASEQEPCEDCISREAVLDFIADMSFEVTADGRIMIKRRTLEEYISDMPSVQPQPKTGKWVYGDHRCPCCGEDKFKDLDADIWADWFPKYCPNCGAKMESEV